VLSAKAETGASVEMTMGLFYEAIAKFETLLGRIKNGKENRC
jgi:hypothetical protein